MILYKRGIKYWNFEDEGVFYTPSKFTINTISNDFYIVYENNLKSKKYNVSEVTLTDLVGSGTFTFANINLFMEKLEELNCPCFQKDVTNINNPPFNPATTDLDVFLNNSADPYVRESELPQATSVIYGLINTTNILANAQAGGISTIMHTFSTNGTILQNSLLNIDFIALRTVGAISPNLTFACYITNNATTLTGGGIIASFLLNATATGMHIFNHVFIANSIVTNIGVKNAGNQAYAPITTINFAQPIYLHFYILNSGSVSADTTRWFNQIQIKLNKTI